MFRKIILSAVTTVALAGGAMAAGPLADIEDIDFSFEGPFGTYDQFQLQRGLQVYAEVCSACHGMTYVPIRTLADEGGPNLPPDQVRAFAAGLDEVEMPDGTTRPREWTDTFPRRFGLGTGPDLSLMAKARTGFGGPEGTGINQLFKGIGGPEYIHAILTGYTGETKEEAGTTFYENHAFPGGWIAMAPPLSDDQVTFADGSASTLDAMSTDVSAYLMWTAEPKMMDRKKAGFIAVTFLILLSALLYLTNKKIWARVKGKEFTA
ncbi:cytochrome c1 [Pseudogemmobacter bohemicus]|uniref:cytochrome c1 n=1 Tax=Pseudogemmobacter bohemicus TaxID=2250708 RepID=UPI000DD42F92|nr:cytochrome c1 [Pseudogemmobacter bohemicus]